MVDEFIVKCLKDLLKLVDERWDFEDQWEAWAMAKQNARLAIHLEELKFKECKPNE